MANNKHGKIHYKNDVDIFHGLSNEIPKVKNKNIPYIVTIHDLIFKRFPRNYRSIDRKIL